MPHHLTSLWLVGTGAMAREYAKVLDARQQEFITIGRSTDGCAAFEIATGHAAVPGGVDAFLADRNAPAQSAIVAVNPNQLASVACSLLVAGVKRILLEKPAGLNLPEIQAIRDTAVMHHAEVYVAYNRRFFASVLAGEKQIAEDGGVTSFHFEFTEWSHRIVSLPKPREELAAWFLANSTHVVDTAFFLGGHPKSMHCIVSGSLPWYPRAAVFAGSGIADSGALFTYEANWKAPGRWAIEVLTAHHRLIYRPMEQLQIQTLGSVAVTPVALDDALDQQFKPGLYLQTQAFLAQDASRLLSIEAQARHMAYYEAMQDGTAYSA